MKKIDGYNIDNNFDTKALDIVSDYIVEHLDKTDIMPKPFNLYIVWKCKILKNWKFLISSDIPDGMYYELTYNLVDASGKNKTEKVNVKASEALTLKEVTADGNNVLVKLIYRYNNFNINDNCNSFAGYSCSGTSIGSSVDADGYRDYTIKITISKTTSKDGSINIIYGTDKFVMTDDEGIDEVKIQIQKLIK